jgi:hypothetical protein
MGNLVHTSLILKRGYDMQWLWNHAGIIGLIWALLIVVFLIIWNGICRINGHYPGIEDVEED